MFNIRREGSIAVVTMTHGKANALDIEFCDALATAFDELRLSADAVVLTGRGKIFSAGVDLVRATTGGPDYFRSFLPSLSRLYETIFFHPKPVVAAINGHAIAGGCVLACCADRRVMAREPGRIGVTELLVGLPFPALAFEIMRFGTAPQHFSEVIVGAATYMPADSYDRGLVDEIAEADAVLGQALQAAERLAALRPAAFAQTKRQLRQPVLDKYRRDGARDDAAVTAVWLAPEAAASIQDYVARTLKKA